MQDEALAGGFAGVVGTLLGFPLDTIKTHMQTSSGPSRGIVGTASSIAQEKGLLAFYSGVSSPLLALVILNTVNFSRYARFCKALGVDLERRRFEPRVLVAASLVGPVASSISTPFELLKIQLQIQSKSGSSAAFTSTFDAARVIVRERGPLGLFVGHGVNTVRECVFLAAYFGVYEHTKSFFITHLAAMGAVPLAGGMAGSVGWLLSYPLDAVKSNIQGQPLVGPSAVSAAGGRILPSS